MHRFRLRITSRRPSGEGPPPGQRPVLVTPPSIPTVAEVGTQITATPGVYDNGVDNRSYKWYADGVQIIGTSNLSYTPVSADSGKKLKNEEVASNSYGNAAPALSNETDTVTSPVTPDAISFGVKTRRGYGGADVGLPGTVTITGGNTGSVWAIDAYGFLVIAGTYGTAPPTLSFPYTLTVSNGTTSRTFTVNGIANAFSVRPHPTDSGGTNQINATLKSGAVNYGDHVILRNGTTFGLNASGDINDMPNVLEIRLAAGASFGVRSGGPSAPVDQGWSGPNFVGTTHLHPGWVKIRPETPLGATITRIDMNGYNNAYFYVQFDGVVFKAYNIGGASGASTAAIWVKTSGVNSTQAWYWISVINCDISSRMEAGEPSSTKICSGIFLQETGSSGNFYIYDNYIHDCYNGIIRSGSVYEIVGNDTQLCYNDGVKGIAFGGLVSWNIIRDKTFIGTAHGDYFQEQWQTVAVGDYEGTSYVGNIMFIGFHGAAGQVGGQGIFVSGAKVGVNIHNFMAKGNVYIDAMVRGISVSRAINPDVRYNVIVKDQADTYPVGTPRVLFAATTGGTAKNNTVWAAGASGPVSIDTAAGVITPPTDVGNYAVSDGDIPAAYAAPVFGPDCTVQQIREAFTSKVGGPLDTSPAKGIGVGTTYVDFVNRTTNFPD
jgi:hypothetical protein